MQHAQQNPYPGSYYGPPIPPQQPSYQRPRSCFCCLFSTIIKAFIGFCVALAIIILVLWLVYRPHKIKFSVENASLSDFSLTTTSPTYLNYSLSTNVSIRNPNKKVGVYYDWLEAQALYSRRRFGWTPLPTFYQGHKNTTLVSPSFSGRTAMDSGVIDVFRNENSTRFFNIDLWFFARVRFRMV
ncbi:hypothetical protein J5N97_022523 [Dioscorea zingiberensis]|uniref:Late embryogenesis abundant protein LEA-2 subgroup domain-containing protein n=1 Tax=Dioscorea zingiberensis TaxID=325984 RepID=A0A9D5HAM1_9LILI|nr:hypothetical protein J5N97_022523 [Dioscorea zingiberensis]